MREFSWQKDGIQLGTMTREEWIAGGKWTVGNAKAFPAGHPGRSELIMYKSWVATQASGKYRPGAYTLKDRHAEGLHEFVQVLDRVLTVHQQEPGKKEITSTDLTVSNWVAIPPDTLRSWSLPNGQPEARGVTILCPPHPMFKPNAGILGAAQGFAYELLSSSQTIEPLTNSLSVPGLAKQYVEVFTGSFLCQIGGKKYRLDQGDYLYRQLDVSMTVRADHPYALGIVLYYR